MKVGYKIPDLQSTFPDPEPIDSSLGQSTLSYQTHVLDLMHISLSMQLLAEM